MDIALLLYDEFIATDVAGPYDVFSRMPDARVRFVAEEARQHSTHYGLTMVAHERIEDVPAPDVIVIPGGPGLFRVRKSARVLDWLRAADATSAWTTAVSNGALLLGEAGLLEGRRATADFTSPGKLAPFGARFVDERWVRDGKLWTAAGSTAGLDMAIALAAEIAGEELAQMIEFVMQYDPRPPFGTGSVARAPARVVRRVTDGMAAAMAKRGEAS